MTKTRLTVRVELVAIEARLDLAERVALERHAEGQRLGCLFDLLRVEPLSALDQDIGSKQPGVERRQRALDIDCAEAITLPLIDGEGNEEAATAGIEIGGGRDDADVGVAVLHVELPQQLAIETEAVLIVDIVALEKAQDVRLRRRNDVAELRIAEGGVADKIDGPHLGGGPFRDLEHHVDAVGIEVDDLGIDLCAVEALAPVDVEDALNVGLHARAGIDGARLELHLRGEGFVVDLPVAFKGDVAHDRVFDDDNDDGAPLPPDTNVLEQAGGKQDLQRFVDLGGIVAVARRKSEVRADRLRLYPLVAFDTDGLDGGALSERGKLAKARAHTQRERDATQHKEGCEQPSGERPPHHYWCLPLKADPRRRYGFRRQTGRLLWPFLGSYPLMPAGAFRPPRSIRSLILSLTKTYFESSHSRLQKSST